MTVAPILLSFALAASPFQPDNPEPGAARQPVAAQAVCSAGLKQSALKAEARARGLRPVANLPESYGKAFRTLDAYLVHLQCYAAPVDAAWWQEVAPGIYRQVTTATNARPKTATRAQLMRRYGFRR